MGMTIAEKILTRYAGVEKVRPGDMVKSIFASRGKERAKFTHVAYFLQVPDLTNKFFGTAFPQDGNQ